MDIQVYDAIKDGLKAHFAALNLTKSYNPDIVGFEPSNPKYPMIKIDESRNVPYGNFTGKREKVASLGYRIDIYAKTTGSLSKQHIARTLAKHCEDYLNCIGLKLVSWNRFENDGLNGDLYHIIMMYNASYNENRQTILI